MSPRATPMAPDERRRTILAAAVPLILERGQAATTRQIAEAAGVAEGTVFRVFPTKEDLLDAVLDAALDPAHFLAELARVDRSLPLEPRLVAATRVVQGRFREIFGVMTALGIQGPPRRSRQDDEDALAVRRRSLQAVVELVEPDADAFRVPVREVARMLRLLTFSGSHPHLSADEPLTAEEIVAVVLHGTLTPTATTPDRSA
ncbi:TetR family transcriptional regulator [Nocardioides zeae]|uniref:TetR/AcrR family transcriptional regulator n=1 Tax=Nocardioides zeae TaxID=1457234 RepID=A0A6P0HQW2_9ACTN|nr:TetR/AcrR family transcriptional regulator [Nocardioides zeae]